MNYADFTCLWCGLTFESLPFYGCCSRCYAKPAVAEVVDAAHPQTNAFERAANEVAWEVR